MSTKAKSTKGDSKPVHFRRLNAQRKPKGLVAAPDDIARVRELLGDAPRGRQYLIENLHKIQDSEACLPKPLLAALAVEMKMPQAAVYEVATFYHHFHVVDSHSDKKTVTVRVCRSLSCEMNGAAQLMETLQKTLGDSAQVIAAPCVGRCAAAPVAVVEQNAMEVANADAVAAAVRDNQIQPAVPTAVVFADSIKNGGYVMYQECISGKRDAESVMNELEKSNLRGLGGAGFPAARKWRIVRDMQGEKIVAVNIDEGEPGTFKDRYYLEQNPHWFLEGALIAAWAVSARRVYIYLRDEYHGCRVMLEREVSALRAADFMKQRQTDFVKQRKTDFALPELHLRRGAGAYICGEESAMIESIEGKRGEPRLRPPFVAQVGVFGNPTLEHNMETLHWVPQILQKGAAWFADHGRRGRSGLRSFSVSGRVKLPGVHAAPAGLSVRELIDEYCGGMLDGHEFYAYLPGGHRAAFCQQSWEIYRWTLTPCRRPIKIRLSVRRR